MAATELVLIIIIFLLSGVLFALSIRSFLERDYPLNNAYIFASEQEREKMDKKPIYRQSAIVFLLLSIVFIIIGLSVIFHNDRIALLEIPLIAATFIYAIISSVKK